MSIQYTKPITYKNLLGKLNEIAVQMKAKVVEEGATSDGKVSSAIHIIFKDGSYVEFYDYKQTVLYDPSYKKVEALRKSAYEYHVQGTNQMILKGVMLMLDMENE